MPSIFVLCDFGVPYNTVLRLREKNVGIYDIVNNPNSLNEVLGVQSEKAEKIKGIILNVVSSGKQYSIYDLVYCGLSKGIAELLIRKNITIDDINEKLLNKGFITDSSYKKIMNAFNKFIISNNIKLTLDEIMLYKLIKAEYNYESFTKQNIIELIENKNFESKNLSELITVLISSRKLVENNDFFCIAKPKLIKELKKISTKNNHYDIVMKKLSGMTLEAVGNEYNVTRERIRQIISKELAKLDKTQEEEKYSNYIETYLFDCDLFCDFFNEKPIVYYFLKEKYKMGDIEPSELIEKENLNSRQLCVLQKKYNLINYNGEIIVAKKTDILFAILKKYKRVMEYSEIINEYNNIIFNNNLELEKLSDIDFRNIDSILNRSNNVLCDAGKYYRYFDTNVLDDSIMSELKKMLDVESGDYSSEFFFNNNKLLMKTIGIKNEYELHNFLRKIVGNCNGRIAYSRMPDIFIDCNDKNEFIEYLIHELSPISIDEFLDYVYQNYGHKNNTLRSLLVTYFNKYINNNMLISECPEFSEEQFNILKEKLTEDVYSIITLKNILTELFDVNDFKLLNNMNMSKLGYKVRGNYIMKSNITNLEAYMRKQISTSDYYEINPEIKKIGSTFSNYFYKFISDYELFKIEDEKYITIKKLNELGITKEDIKHFIEELEEKIVEDKYFNIYSLNKDDNLTKIKEYNFPNCFYETILYTIPDLKTFKVRNNFLFIKSSEQPTREKFINSFVKKEKTFISEIKQSILNDYNIDLPEYYIRDFIDRKKYYFDTSIDCVYLNKDIYEQEVNDIDILKYID